MNKKRKPRILLPAELFSKFRTKAEKEFPKEVLGLFFGALDNEDLLIKELVFPTKRDISRSDQTTIEVSAEFYLRAVKRMKRKDLYLLGDIHSHCWPGSGSLLDATRPSDTDVEDARTMHERYSSYCFFAILGLTETGTKHKLSFYPAPLEEPYLVVLEGHD